MYSCKANNVGNKTIGIKKKLIRLGIKKNW